MLKSFRPLVVVAAFVACNATGQIVQEIVPAGKNQPPESRAPDAFGAGVKLLHQMLEWAGDAGLERRVRKEIDALGPQIKKAMPENGGVLVVVGIQRSKQPDPTGVYLRSFLDAYVAGGAATAKLAIDAYLAKDRLDASPPTGWVRETSYFWVTR